MALSRKLHESKQFVLDAGAALLRNCFRYGRYITLKGALDTKTRELHYCGTALDTRATSARNGLEGTTNIEQNTKYGIRLTFVLYILHVVGVGYLKARVDVLHTLLAQTSHVDL